MSEPRITKCPTAYAGAYSTGTISEADRLAIATHHAEREATTREKKLPFFAGSSPPPPSAPVSSVVTPAEKPKKEIEPMPLDGRGTTRNKLFLSASEEVSVFRFKDGRSEVHVTDHMGREYVSRFGRNRQFQGTEWRNAAAFRDTMAGP